MITIPAEGAPGLLVHRASDTAALAHGLAQLLATPLPDPFATEVVSVPTPGVERWLSQTLAAELGSSGRGDGVSAGIDFVRLDALVRDIIGTSLGIDRETDPWHPQRAVWAVLRVLDQALDRPWAAPIRAQLGSSTAGSGRYRTATRLFGLFRSYAVQRPEMLRSWRRGEFVDASGDPLDEYARWQPELWSALRVELGGPDPVDRVDRAAEMVAADPARIGLPGRISVFGPTRLAGDQAAVLAALARERAVHLWLPHPSPALWDRISEQCPAGTVGPRAADPTTLVPRHRLNRRLARDARELQQVLTHAGAIDGGVLTGPDRPESAVPRLLDRLRAAVHDDVEQPAPHPLAADDDSVRLHACHGPDRQVEVLREVVLGLLEDHPDLELRDIIVICPDLESFAPLISAAFALGGGGRSGGRRGGNAAGGGLGGNERGGVSHPGQTLQVRLADRSLRELNPLFGTLVTLLGLSESRAGLSQVLDLCAQPPVARRFGFGERDLERLRQLAPLSGVRWGLDSAHRARFHMGGFGQNTWRAGLERMLLGIAMDETGHTVRGTVLPLEHVESSDALLVGRLAELLSRLERVVDNFTRPQTLPEWMSACRTALELLTDVPHSDNWQLAHAWSELAALAESAAQPEDPGATQQTALLGPSDVRAALTDAFAGRPGRANFRSGALTVCTPAPMRSVPHRAVILLGLDDGVFPRRGHDDGDDLLAGAPWIGDPDPRSEDRQVLLDAVLAARDHLVVIHCGASAQTGEPRPPAVPLAELRHALAELCTEEPWSHLETRHPLQPFAPENFHPHPKSFDAVACRAAAALLRSRDNPDAVPPRTFDLRGLPAAPELAADRVFVTVRELTDFFAHPARQLLRRRAQLYPGDEPEIVHTDEIPLHLDPLARWKVGDRMLRAHLAGAELGDLVRAEYARGDVPPRARGGMLLADVEHQVRETAAMARPFLASPAQSIWVDIDLGAHWQVSGMLTGIRDRRLVQVAYSRLEGKQRIASWVKLLALKVFRPDIEWRAVTIGRGGRTTILGPIAEVDARARLTELCGIWARGAQELIPLPPNTAALWAQGARHGRSPGRPVMDKWTNEHDADWDRFGLRSSLGSLNSLAAHPADRVGDRSAFEALALKVFGPMLEVEEEL